MSLHQRELSLNRLTTPAVDVPRPGLFIILIMKNLLIGVIIGVLLAVIQAPALRHLKHPSSPRRAWA